MITRVLNRTRPAAWLMIVVMWLAACGGNGGADNDGGAGSPATGIGSAGGADNDGGADSPATGNEDTGGADNDGGANSPADGNGSAGGNDNDGNGGVEPPAANRAPEAQPFCNTTVQGESLTAMLQASDTEDDPLTYSFNTASASPAQTRLETDAGVVTLDPETGQFTYDPNEDGPRGADTFTYRVDDADGFDIAEVEIVVAPTIMPLGDSITRGDMADEPVPQLAGYRRPLYNGLLEAGFAAPDDSRTPAFDFVGSTDAAGAALDADFDRDNEGHGACTDVGIATGQMNGRNCAKPAPYTGITNAINLNPPDIVLLHIGTNNGLENDIGADGVADILRRIRAWEESPDGNDVTVVLARIIDDRRDGSFNPRRNQVDPKTDVAGFNENLTRLLFKNPNNLSYPLRVEPSDPNVVDGFPDAQGFPRDIILVDQFSTLDPELDEPIENVEDYANRLHPSASGYAKMANVWLRALTGAVGPEILASCPQSSP